ncbi:type I-E CRISPR-associated protein Cas5/CasD [Halorhodospira halochloris]|uniref:type I-E CRISPR-associated protein Cas5/CasD n=1 Tax=Halorhodospira halochloris TaxID=1052 RepID=UPI001EE7DF7B|nr:type I-E CRISPR-associated protein Cas5/CasD [Halorhodospira halochloris]MCG5549533.1 type I-E CRISPR-associated protein Cas5/CasD [Halorhodospira halochloris]
MKYLVFQLYGPLASWGVPATGEVRRSATYPGRSALLGLIAAALGIPRQDESTLASLGRAVRFGVKQLSPGALLQDYHTAQVPGHDRKAFRLTRGDELAAPRERLNTIISTREYRCDGYWKVAVPEIEESDWDLVTLKKALEFPRFPLSLGRKACPPAAPLAPQIVEASGFREALDTPFPELTGYESTLEERSLLGIAHEVIYSWEGDGGDIKPQETRQPYDDPIHRGRWQFASRLEYWHQSKEEG